MCTAKWIEHECGQQLSVKDYALQMQRCRGRVCWGGALEILAYSRLRSVNVAVWILFPAGRAPTYLVGCESVPGSCESLS